MFARTTKPQIQTQPQTPRHAPAAPLVDTYADPAPAPRVHPVAASVVGANLILEGTVAGDVELHIDGAVRGDIHVARLVIGENGYVEGRVRAQSVDIRGRVIGDIEGQRVKLSETAYVRGDILHELLTIEPGAYFQGVCRQPGAEPPAQAAPRPAAQAAQPPMPWEKAS